MSRFRLPKGPDLKDLKPKNLKVGSLKESQLVQKVSVPPVVADLFRDMRDRHLLPLVAVAAIAIVAVPLLLSSSAPELTSTEGTTGIPIVAGGEPPELTVVADTSGLRDYRKRLRHLEKKNPFRQHFSTPALSGSQLNGTGTGGGGSSTSVPTTPSTDSPETFSGTDPQPVDYPVDVQTYDGQDPVGPPGGSGGGHGQGHGNGGVSGDTEFVSYEIDVKIARPSARAGDDAKPKTSVRRGVQELEMLPSEKNPVVVFMGVSPDREKALFLVSDRVNSVFGDVKCMYGSESCQLLMLEPGLPATFVYGANDRRFRLNVLGIDRVTHEKP
ncbi:MAG TPA: hypothetical protein VKA89_03275 [Solirubrobacterales bacterium]|nr:hypothetical protein [Solirubrobacterales bacterium]